MKPTSRYHRGFVAATLGLTVCLALPVVFSGSILLAQAAGQPSGQPGAHPQEAATHSVALRTVTQSGIPQPRQLAAQRLHDARRAVATRDIATAERLLNEVAAMQLEFQPNEDQPARIQNLIQDYRRLMEQAKTQENSEQFRQQYARFLLIQADTMLRRNELDLATQLTQEAVKQQVQYYSPEDKNNGLEPMAMAQRINDARRVQNMHASVEPIHNQNTPQPLSQAAQAVLEQALQMLQQARVALDAGQFEQAEQIARRAASAGLPESAFPQGNSPNRFLSEIAARRQGMSVPPPVNPQVMGQPQMMEPSQVIQASNSQPVLAPQIPVPGRNTPYIDQTLINRQAAISQISSEVIQQLSEAQRLTTMERKPDAALDLLYNAKRRVEQENQLDAQSKGIYLQQIDRAIAETVSFRERYASQDKQDRVNEAVWAELRHEQARFLNKEEQLASMFREYKKLIDDQRFEEALIVAKKAREFAPDAPETQVLATMAQMVYNVNRSHDVRDLKRDGVVEALLDVDRASVIPNIGERNMMYAPDWAALSNRRQASNRSLQYQRPLMEQRINRQLEMPVTFNVNQAVPLEQALQMLCNAVEINYYLDRAALQEADVPTGTMVVIPTANGIRMRNVLSTVLAQHGLTYVVKNEMLNITSTRRARGDLVTRVYYVGDLLEGDPMTMSSNYIEDAFNRAYDRQNPHANRNGNAGSGPAMQGMPGFDGVPMSYYRMPNAIDGDPNVLAQFGGGMMGGGMGMGGMGGGSMGGMGGGMMGGGMGGGMMGGGMGGMGG
ncbi:MAG: hypothetical protein FWG73_08575, partial [Planctomycetaceae bacterium]|nr:hypothetical protein [Planctomycetaceae bacterium]